MRQQAVCFLLLFFSIVGCSKVPTADDAAVVYLLEKRIDSTTEWRQGRGQDEQVTAFIEEALAHELSADIAVQIALLNNPHIQGIFEELGIARADWVAAGLFSNPSFDVIVRFPHTSGLWTNIEYMITSSLLDIFLVPLRTRLAETEYEQTKLSVADQILDLAFEVRETVYELMTEESKLSFLHSALGLTRILSDLSAQQLEVGNIDKLTFQLAQSRCLEADLEKERSQAEIIRLREKLNRLLGLSEDVNLIISHQLPKNIDDHRFEICTLESIALEERLDVQVARFEIERLCQKLGLKDWWTYTNFRGGVAGERELDGQHVLGFGLLGDLPVFNNGQAARMRLYAQLRQAQDRLTALEIQVLSQTREAFKLLTRYSEIVHRYRDALLPTQQRILATSEELYNAMGLGVDRLLENKLREIEIQKNYADRLKKYLVARVELDRALGGNLFRMYDGG